MTTEMTEVGSTVNEYTFISVRLKEGHVFTHENIKKIWEGVDAPGLLEVSADIVELSNKLGYHVVCSKEGDCSTKIMCLPFVAMANATNTFEI